MVNRIALINKIVSKAKDVFLDIPGVVNVELYGSIKAHKADMYSDIDFEIISSNPQATTDNFIYYLRKIDDYYVILPISITEKERVYTIVWKSLPFYQKMDIRLIFNCKFPVNKNLVKYNEHLRDFHSFFIGAIRYTKYRKRKMHWSAFKFYKASIEMWTILKTKDKSFEGYVKLDKLNKKIPNKWIYQKNSVEMDANMIEISKSFLKFCGRVDDFGQRVIKFMRAELKSRKGSN